MGEATPSASNWGSRNVDLFEKVEQVGEGTYGQVYKAKCKETGEVVALKRVRMDNEKEGFPITAIREIKILKVLNHKNVVRLKEIVTSKGGDQNAGKGSIYMVMEFCEHDLTGLVDAGQRFTSAQIKCLMKQLLEGMAYCHKNRVLHRDIKGSNLLINHEGLLKLADFGLARPFDEQQRNFTNRVITLWYRPPELLLGAQQYGPSIDMWSVGCIFAELLLRKPILPGKDEFEQMKLIINMFGTPTEETWPGVKSYQHYDLLTSKSPNQKSRFEEYFGQLDEQVKDLLRQLLSMDPSKRINAFKALDHDYFWTDPLPVKPHELPKVPSSHEYTAKIKRQKAQQQRQQQQQLQQQQQQGHHVQPHPSHGHAPPYQQYPPHAGQRGPPPPGGGYSSHAPKRYRDGGGYDNGGYDYGRPPPGGVPPGGYQPPHHGGARPWPPTQQHFQGGPRPGMPPRGPPPYPPHHMKGPPPGGYPHGSYPR